MENRLLLLAIWCILGFHVSQETPGITSSSIGLSCGKLSLTVKSTFLRLNLRGGSTALDDEIEALIDNNDMIANGSEGATEEDIEQEKAPKRKKRKPLPNIAELFRKISGDIVLFSDFPGKNATKDTQYGWKSDRYIMVASPNVTFFNEKGMVPFDDEAFNRIQHFDERYNKTWNVSEWSRDIAVSNDGKKASFRLQTGDVITDHVVYCVLHGIHINERAVYINMTNSRWKPPQGWKRAETDLSEQQDPPTIYYEPVDYAYITWSHPQRRGTSRWIVHVDCANGPLFLGVMKRPKEPPKVNPEELRTRCWGISEGGYAFRTDETGCTDLDDLTVAQLGVSNWPPYFATGSVIFMVLDRDHGFLQFTVSSQSPFALFGVDPDVVPFYCTKTPGDSLRLLSGMEGLLQMPLNLRNDVIARWSIQACEVEDNKGPARYEFWPGGRIKMNVEDEEEELKKILEDTIDDRVFENFENAFADYNEQANSPFP